MKNTIKMLFVLMIFTLVSVGLMAEPLEQEKQQGCKVERCNSCHVIRVPTDNNSELKSCPVRYPVVFNTAARDLTGKETVKIDVLMDKFEGSRFRHNKHAEHAMMDKDCGTCHHFHTDLEKPPAACSSCHPKRIDRENPGALHLKAAYHRRCIGCHRKWYRQIQCDICHVKKGETATKRPPYPLLKTPDKKVYNTDHDDPIVTFYHDEHATEYDLSCDECHVKTTCAACHNRKQDNTKDGPVLKASHDNNSCFKCHEDTSCETCHSQE